MDPDQLDENFKAVIAGYKPDVDGKLLAAQLERITAALLPDVRRLLRPVPAGPARAATCIRYVSYAEGYGEFALGRDELPAPARRISSKCAAAIARTAPSQLPQRRPVSDRVSPRSGVVRLRVWLLTFAASALFAQTPDCSIAPGSKQDGKPREFDTETLYEYMDGNSEGYFLYGFSKMRGITCKKAGPVTLIVDLSEFKSPELAYGMFTGNLDPRLPIEKIGAGGQVVDRKVIFVKGACYAEIAAEPEGKHADLLRTAAKEWEKKLTGSAEPPAELKWFPKEKLQPGSPRLVPQSVLGMRMLKRGYLAAL